MIKTYPSKIDQLAQLYLSQFWLHYFLIKILRYDTPKTAVTLNMSSLSDGTIMIISHVFEVARGDNPVVPCDFKKKATSWNQNSPSIIRSRIEIAPWLLQWNCRNARKLCLLNFLIMFTLWQMYLVYMSIWL